MKQKLFMMLVGATCAAVPTVFFGGMLIDHSNRIQEQQVEILNLRGYKYAFIEHITKCDTLHINCIRRK